MPGLYYEQFQVGMTFDHPWTRTVTEGDNVLFSTMTMNPQPLHLDAQFAAESEFGERLVNSLFTLGLLVGVTVYELTLGTTIANLGFGKVEFPKPVFHGDTLHAESTVTEARASGSRPDAGPGVPARERDSLQSAESDPGGTRRQSFVDRVRL